MSTLPEIAIIALALLTLTAQATVVTTAADEDNGFLGGGTGISLREAVKYSPAGDAVTFAPVLNGQTIRLTLGYIQRLNSITIDASSLPNGITISAKKTVEGISAADSYVFLFGIGNIALKSLTLTDASVGESSGCIKIYDKQQVHLTLDRCTLTRNSGYHAGALYAVGIHPGSSITVRNSTFSKNTADKGGAAIDSHGFALTIENSTFFGNTGGAIHFSGGPLSLNSVTITGSTRSASSTSAYAGIYVSPDTATTFPISIQNTICAGNTPHNLNTFSYTGTNNLFTGDPQLFPLGDYGGSSQTMPPNAKSAAIDLGATTPLTTDQRGLPRLGPPDIGAAEYQGDEAETTLRWNFDSDGDGFPYGIETALGTNHNLADSSNTRNLKPPTFNASGHAVLRFGIGTAPPGTRWILTRSTDLHTFTEIYRYSHSTHTAARGITYTRNYAPTSSVTITDTHTFPGGAFYRFEAVYQP